MAPEIYFPNIGIKINKLNRVALSIFGVDVYWYGLIIVTAILIGYFMIDRNLKKQGSSIDEYMNFILIVIITTILGARTYYVAFSWDYYKNNLGQIFNLRNGGIAIYGGIIAAIITAIIYCKVSKKSFMKLADTFSPYLILGQAMGRWGNFFNREAFGGTTDSLFAMALRTDTVKAVPDAVRGNIFTYFEESYIQVHPTFLYESLACFLIFVFLLYTQKKKKFEGEVFLKYVVLYSFIRFFVEGLRTDQLLIFSIPISQIVAVALFITGLVVYIIKFKSIKKQKE